MINIIGNALRTLAKNVRGAATVEFAIIAPVFVSLLVFSVNGFDAYRGVRRASNAVDIIADLTSRLQVLDAANRDAMFTTANALLDRYAVPGQVEVIISSIEQDADGDYQVLWSVANEDGLTHSGTLPNDFEISLPPIPVGESIILAELDAEFQPVFLDLWDGVVDADQFAIRRPRLISQIAYQP